MICAAGVAYLLLGILYIRYLWNRWPPESDEQVCIPGLVIACLIWIILFLLIEVFGTWEPPYQDRNQD
jgi:hypothetical protein